MDQYLEFVGRHTILTLGLLASFFLVIFTELRRKAQGLVNVEAAAAVKLINNDATVVDLRSTEAFGRGHIVGAKNIVFEDLDAKLAPLDKAKPVIAVCDSGISSNRAVDKLRKAGFEAAFGLKGGMNAWTQEGLPVVTGKKTKSKSRKKDSKKG